MILELVEVHMMNKSTMTNILNWTRIFWVWFMTAYFLLIVFILITKPYGADNQFFLVPIALFFPTGAILNRKLRDYVIRKVSWARVLVMLLFLCIFMLIVSPLLSVNLLKGYSG